MLELAPFPDDPVGQMKLYEYKNCSTCRKAIKYLDARGVAYERIPIRETPPTHDELRSMLKYLDGDEKRLFNTSGGDYLAMNLKDTLPDMDLDAKIQLLHENGNLVKRPFLIGKDLGVTGFKEAEWDALF